MRDLDTTERIIDLCDADNRSASPLLSEAAEWVMIRDLQREYLYHLWQDEWTKVVIAITDATRPALEQLAKSFRALAEQFNSALDIRIELLSKSLTNRQRIWRENCNNYRKIHALPLKRRPRCRWRQRESRRKLEGLSPGTVVIDELHEWKG